jgi:signal transduction histidine kinase
MPLLSTVYFGYYKVGRFVFVVALLVAFQMVGLLLAAPWLFYMLAVYSIVALVRLFIPGRSVGYLDYILDIIFISALVFVSFRIYSYLTLFYLFPIFFASLAIRGPRIYIYPLVAVLLYSSIFQIRGDLFAIESLFNITLHALSFFIMALAASHLSRRIERQEEYIGRLEEEKIKMQGYERLYRVSADLAHELRNPLASISAAVQFMKEGKSSSDFVDMLGDETIRLTNLVNDFLMFSRPSDAPKEDIDLCEMIRTISERYGQGVTIKTDLKEGLHINANRVYLDAALGNIVRNATEAAKESVLITLRHVARLDKAGKEISIVVGDDGQGIEKSLRDRIFEPFVTTKKTGTGLGLALAYRVITTLGGNLVAGESGLGGAEMVVTLPVAADNKDERGLK